MKLALLTNIVSPHQLPFAEELARRLGADNFRYVATELEHAERKKLGWLIEELPPWVVSMQGGPAEHAEGRRWCNEASFLLSGLRDLPLLERRADLRLTNLYMFERWFKPRLGGGRVLSPGFRRMAHRLWSLHREGAVTYLPIGIHAAKDMMRIGDLFTGRWARSVRAGELSLVDRAPMSQFMSQDSKGASADLIVPNMHLWGYFVGPSELPRCADSPAVGEPPLLRVLWLGRMLDWKRADTLVSAVVRLLRAGHRVSLRLIGHGPEERRLKRLAGAFVRDDYAIDEVRRGSSVRDQSLSESVSPGIRFGGPIPITEVRREMHRCDVVVMASNAAEGWGAVVNEAMAEGRCVIGTFQAGSSATMIEHGVNGWLYSAGDVDELSALLRHIARTPLAAVAERARSTLDGPWSPAAAAERLLEHVGC